MTKGAIRVYRFRALAALQLAKKNIYKLRYRKAEELLLKVIRQLSKLTA